VLGNASAIADWQAGMAALGALPNVYVKWGGLAQYYKSTGAVPTLAQVAPFANFALDHFPGRAVFERNWFFWCVLVRAKRRAARRRRSLLNCWRAHAAHTHTRPPRLRSNFLTPPDLNVAETWSSYADEILTSRGASAEERESVLQGAARSAYGVK
jgi:hypothetical protein